MPTRGGIRRRLAKLIGSFTFSPREKGYYFCNQTKEITKNPKHYRFLKRKGRPFRIPKEAKELLQVRLDEKGYWVCPAKNSSLDHSRYEVPYKNYSEKTRVIAECGCGIRVWITKHEPTEERGY